MACGPGGGAAYCPRIDVWRPRTPERITPHITSIIALTLVLGSLLIAPIGFVRSGRWTRAAYRTYAIIMVVLYGAAIGLILTRFGRG